MDLIEIVTEWLKEKGYDGLYDEDYECGCILSDLMPCDEPRMRCCPGYKGKGGSSEEGAFFVGPERDKD